MSATASELAFLARAMKAPRVAQVAASMAARAEAEGWDHQTYLAAVLAEEVAARETHGGQHRIKAARFPQVKTLDDFDFTFQRSVKAATISHLAQLDFLHEAHNVVFLGPPGTGKTHLSIALGVQAARRGHRVAFASAQDWVGRLAAVKRAGRLEDELDRLRRTPLVIVDEVGYIPFDPDAAALFFSSQAATSGPASSSAPTRPSPHGPRSSETPPPSKPWSTASSTTPKSSCCRETATDSRTAQRR